MLKMVDFQIFVFSAIAPASVKVSYRYRRSQGGQRGHAPQKCLEHIVILCFERHFSKQNSYSPKIKHFGPPIMCPQNFWAGYATAYRTRSIWRCIPSGTQTNL